ncbi:MAG: helix-turn-helix transcriptional regulator [Clostridia bacterium]|nr:helix-turn-helix transcriptional regulator [Clostridia bacterium]
MLLAFCAMWRGDIALWNEAKKHILEAPHTTEEEREIISLALTIIDSSVYDNKDYPVWFSIGNFEALPADSHPAAKVFYVKFLYMAAHGLATKQFKLEGVEGLALMRMIPNTIEPLITQAVVDKTVLPEILLRMSCAVAYHNSGMKERALLHIDKAVALALKDKLYGTLTEYVRHFHGLLEERIALVDPSAVGIVKALYATYSVGWSSLSGKIRNRLIATNLTDREREVAKLTAFGFKASEIASMLYLSESTIKQTITRVLNKTGVSEKSELYLIL